MIETTLEDLVETFRHAINTIEPHLKEDEVGADAEYNFLRIITTTLETTLEELDNVGLSDEVKLAVAASRVPGLMYLHQLY